MNPFPPQLDCRRGCKVPAGRHFVPPQGPARTRDEGLRGYELDAHDAAQNHHGHAHAPASRHEAGHHLLQVEDLSVGFRMYEPGASFLAARQRVFPTIKRLNISVHAAEVVAVVGASGAGKTLLADAIMGFYEPNAVVRGRIWVDGELQDAAGLRRLRGKGLSLVPQSVAYLDPTMTVGRQVQGAATDRADARRRVLRQRELFARYGLDAIIILNAQGDEMLVTDHLREEVKRLTPVAERLGCVEELNGVLDIIDHGGEYKLQRQIFAASGGDFKAIVKDNVARLEGL